MTLTELKYIVALAQQKHFGHAAIACHVSQPTLSVGVKKLEDELGVIIFERTKSAINITSIGQDIILQAQKVLAQTQTIKDLSVKGRDPLIAPLRIGAIYTVGPYLFPHLIPQLHLVAPDMPLYIEENFTHILKEKLQTGELDAIIIALPFQEPDIMTKILYDEALYALLPSNHSLAKQDSINSDQLNKNDLLLLGEGHCFRDQVLEVCPQRNNTQYTQQTIIESNSLETIRHMVASGLGVSVLPLSAVENTSPAHKMIAIRPFSRPIPFRSIAIAWRASFPRTKAIDILSDAARLCSIKHTIK